MKNTFKHRVIFNFLLRSVIGLFLGIALNTVLISLILRFVMSLLGFGKTFEDISVYLMGAAFLIGGLLPHLELFTNFMYKDLKLPIMGYYFTYISLFAAALIPSMIFVSIHGSGNMYPLSFNHLIFEKITVYLSYHYMLLYDISQNAIIGYVLNLVLYAILLFGGILMSGADIKLMNKIHTNKT